jgi:ornithine carbamoyltransferase
MKPCASAGTPCPREAVLTARIAGVGDRALCQTCFDAYVAMGMDLRALDPNAYIPEWRKHNLAKVLDHGRGAA